MLSRLRLPAIGACENFQANMRNASVQPVAIGTKSEMYFEKEQRFGAHNYGPMKVAIEKGEGI